MGAWAMDVVATINRGYRWRLAAMAVMCLGWAAYSLYDGMYAYPRQREISEAYQQLREEGRESEWPEYAASRGWPSDEMPGEPYSMWDIYTQYIQVALALPPGLYFAIQFVRTGRWRITMSEQGLTASWGQKALFDRIERIDTSRWKTKGIAVVHYRQGEEVDQLSLDDWKFDPAAIQKMVDEVENRLTGRLHKQSSTPAEKKA